MPADQYLPPRLATPADLDVLVRHRIRMFADMGIESATDSAPWQRRESTSASASNRRTRCGCCWSRTSRTRHRRAGATFAG